MGEVNTWETLPVITLNIIRANSYSLFSGKMFLLLVKETLTDSLPHESVSARETVPQLFVQGNFVRQGGEWGGGEVVSGGPRQETNLHYCDKQKNA